jgi:hypothetical protein
MLKELTELLTCRELSPAELASRVDAIEAAPEDPELEWMEDAPPEVQLQTAITFKLNDFIASADRIDEVHEQLSEFFGEPLPDYPQHEDGSWFQQGEYFVWLDQRLLQRAGEHGSYELLLIGEYFTDDLNAILVMRADTPRVLDIATTMELTIERATERRLT